MIPSARSRSKVWKKQKFVFLTLHNYSMIALSSAMEALRMANQMAGQDVYEWQTATLDGNPVASSNGSYVLPTVSLDSSEPMDIVFVCGGLKVESFVTDELLQVLHNLATRHVALGSLCTGGYALARAGLLDGYRAVIHWENMSGLVEKFPKVHFSKQIYVIDRDRYTCSGGVAPLDLMLNLVQNNLGKKVASMISDQFILDRIRNDNDRQNVPLVSRLGLVHKNLIEAASLMESNLEEPLSLDEIARLVGVSRRQIERLFRRYVGEVPTRYYLEMRLHRARGLLLQTPMSIMEVAVACGFQSSPHFSKCYRDFFGVAPSTDRLNRS